MASETVRWQDSTAELIALACVFVRGSAAYTTLKCDAGYR